MYIETFWSTHLLPCAMFKSLYDVEDDDESSVQTVVRTAVAFIDLVQMLLFKCYCFIFVTCMLWFLLLVSPAACSVVVC